MVLSACHERPRAFDNAGRHAFAMVTLWVTYSKAARHSYDYTKLGL